MLVYQLINILILICKMLHNFFFETKYILIENKIQNNPFQKTEIFNPFPTN